MHGLFASPPLLHPIEEPTTPLFYLDLPVSSLLLGVRSGLRSVLCKTTLSPFKDGQTSSRCLPSRAGQQLILLFPLASMSPFILPAREGKYMIRESFSK